jgi:nucleotide-binding universal stress UspA family protein
VRMPAKIVARTPEPRPLHPIRRILCPVDFSEWSRCAVERAVTLAGPTKAEIIGLFVLPPAAPDSGIGRSSCAEDADESMLSALAEDLEEFFDPVRKAGLRLRVCVKRGDSVTRILEQAREADADVIVMGTHGRSGLQRLLLGSVTDGVTRRAHCPVLAVPRDSIFEVRRTPCSAARS